MLRLEKSETAVLAWPGLATGAIAALLWRSRDFANGSSPGSGVALSEMVSRIPDLAHSAVSVGDRAMMLLFRIAITPPSLAVSALESEFRFAFAALAGLGSFLHSASAWLLHII
jgi:hypothetical protein